MAKTEVLNNDAVTLRIAEPASEIVEKAEDVIEEVVNVTKNNPYILAGVFLIGASLGGFAAYRFGVKRTTLKYEHILEEEIEATRKFYMRLAKEGEFESPESAVEALVPEEAVEALTTYQGRPKVKYNHPETIEQEPEVVAVEVEVKEEVRTRNVFMHSNRSNRWDYDAELAEREANPDKPYVISFEEFQENEDNNEQATLTYYAEDDTLADEKEQPIDNTEYTVGDDNLSRFGHGSKDPNVVYVRNERLSMDFEIIQSRSSYKKDVLGIDTPDSFKHSQRHPNRMVNRNPQRRFRGTDE